MDNLTDFQKSVLKMVRKIPRGRVATYKEVARGIGRPRATRAIGRTLNKNPHLNQIPCHRVVKSNGQIGGYALGAKKKIKLLKKEGILIKRGRVINFSKIFYNNLGFR